MSIVSLGKCVTCFYHTEAVTLILYATRLYRTIHIRTMAELSRHEGKSSGIPGFH